MAVLMDREGASGAFDHSDYLTEADPLEGRTCLAAESPKVTRLSFCSSSTDDSRASTRTSSSLASPNE